MPRSSRRLILNAFRFFWLITVFWSEAGIFFFSLRACRWPALSPFQPGEKPAHILIVSDTQVRRPFPSSSRSIRQYLYDLNLKKSWHVVRRLKPHGVVFLGDILASGKHVTNDTEYHAYSQHFKNAFPVDPSVDVWYLPGNNDVGLGIPRARAKMVRRYFTDHFSPLNFKSSVRNHVLLFLDAPGLVEEDYQRTAQGKQYKDWEPLSGGAVEFVKQNAAVQGAKPVILFSHIPLGRPDTKSCGPLRERGTIRRGVGTGYQNTLGKETTTFLLETLRPSAVFSGDDRDYCDYTHIFHPSEADGSWELTVREVTVKSFSLAKQIRRPGFQLLSLVTPPPISAAKGAQSFADRPCLLPDQNSIYSTVYSTCLILTILVIFVANVYRTRHRPPPLSPIAISPAETRQDRLGVIWSPYTPWSPQPTIPRNTSPRSPLPASLRIPNGRAAPTLRAFSRPSSPHSSPLLSPMAFPHEEEEEDSLYPPQYAVRREALVPSIGGVKPLVSSDEGTAEHARKNLSQFQPAPGSRGVERPPLWSRTFIFAGRRLNLRIPASLSTKELTLFFDGWPRLGKRRNVVVSTAVDVLAIVWPAGIMWIIIARWMF